jgi:hypothetical protein
MCSYFRWLLLGLLLFVVGCGVSRISTTERSAVERSLLATALRKAAEGMSRHTKAAEKDLPSNMLLSHLGGKSFSLNYFSPYLQQREGKARFETTLGTALPVREYDEFFVHSLFLTTLLDQGLCYQQDQNQADFIVYPSVELAHIDDNQHILGLPSIPIPVSGVGTVNTPEIALMGMYKQFGRAKMQMLIVDRATGQKVGLYQSNVTESYYTRWKLLLFLGWRTTNLSAPF